MHFDLSDEQKAIRESVNSLLHDEIDGSRTLKLFDAAALDVDLWRKLMGLGLGTILVPVDSGGLGLDLLTLAVVSETLAHYAVPAPVLSNALAAWLIATAGDVTLRERWLPALMQGDAIAGFALLEPETGWLPTDWSLIGPLLTGEKSSVEWGGTANLLIVGMAGGALGVVQLPQSEVDVRPMNTLDKSRPMCNVTFRHAEVELLQGNGIADRLIDAQLVLLAADACGAGIRAYQMAVEYAQQRVQFGRAIATFQALKHQLANMAIDMEPCRPLYWYAAHAWDTLPEKRARAAAIAKAHITDVSVKTARSSVEAHGGIGYTWEYPLHVYLKRAMHARTSMGLPTLHRERMATLAGW